MSDDERKTPRDKTVERMKKLLYASTILAACSRKDLPSCGGGYAVVDPMPVPAGCMGVAARSTVTAKWKRVAGEGGVTGDGGADVWVLIVELSVPSDAMPDFDAATMYGSGKTLQPTRREALTTIYEVPVTDAQAVFVIFDVPVHCSPDASTNGGNGRITVNVNFDKPGGQIRPQLQDS
jgi:hypothetical protein